LPVGGQRRGREQSIMKDEDLQRLASQGFYYGGEWHAPADGGTFETTSPVDGRCLARIAEAASEDVDRAVAAAQAGFRAWRDTPPLERARLMREGARSFRSHAEELARIDALDGGNPVSYLLSDIEMAADHWDFFAGLVTEIKGSTVPAGPGAVNFSVREPKGVVVRIAPFNHPFLFCGGRLAAPLAIGNVLIVKPPAQAPLSALRMAELLDGLFPPGVINVLPGRRDTGARLVEHPGVAMIAMTGSVPSGRAVARSAADTLKSVMLELGGKNALIALDDVHPERAAAAIVKGMNFTWCGQSCGSTSRAFVHRAIYDDVLERLPEHVAPFVPGDPLDPATTMGAIVDRAQLDRILGFIRSGVEEGARLLAGGRAPDDAMLSRGCFVEPTVFADVTQQMRIAREEIFGPVASIIPWDDEDAMLADVNSVEYGLTASIWTNRLDRAHELAKQVEAGFVWINEVGNHFLGTPFGGVKQSGNGREESINELVTYSQEKHVHVRLDDVSRAP
jgi:betaine-aldehyde dehydrogenase